MQDKRTEFLVKLQNLLDEYNVSISASYDGDTHGIYNERISICHRPVNGSFKEIDWLTINHQIDLSAYDIKCELE